MSLLLTVLLWGLAMLALLVGALLLLPFSVRASGSHWQGRLDAEVRVGWAFGLLSLRWQKGEGASLALVGVRVLRLRSGASSRSERAAKKAKKNKKARALGWFRGHLRSYRRMLATLVRALRLRLVLRGSVGLANPADTAILAQGARSLVPSGEWLHNEVEIDYLDEKFDIEGNLHARLWVCWVSMLLIGMLLRRESRRALLALRG